MRDRTEVDSRTWPSEVPALAIADPALTEGVRVLDALRDHSRPKSRGELTERGDQGLQHLVVMHPVDQAPVDLDDVGGGQHDVPQGGETRAHVVDRQPRPPCR